MKIFSHHNFTLFIYLKNFYFLFTMLVALKIITLGTPPNLPLKHRNPFIKHGTPQSENLAQFLSAPKSVYFKICTKLKVPKILMPSLHIRWVHKVFFAGVKATTPRGREADSALLIAQTTTRGNNFPPKNTA